MFVRCLSLKRTSSSTAFFKSTINNQNTNKKFFRSTPPTFSEHDSDPSGQFITFGTESIEHHSKPITRAYDSQFYSYFPNLITKKKTSLSYEDWLDKEIKETTEEYEKLRKIYLRDEDIHSVDENIRKFDLDGETIYSGTNTRFPKITLERYLPEGWGKRNKILIDFQSIGSRNILTRGWIFDIIDEINRQKSSNFLRSNNCKTVIANGSRGVGISTLLSLLAMYGRSNGWITVNVSGLRITSDHGIDPSRVLKNRYDQNKCAIEIMQHTSKTNYEQLQQIPLRTPVPLHLLDEGLTVTRESTLADILDYGINNEDSATDIFCYFRRELNLVTEFPVLLIVDDYNTLFNPAYYPDMHSESYAVERIAPEKLNLVRCFNDPNATGLLNGVMVCGTTGCEPSANLKKKHSKLFTPVSYMSYAEIRFRYRYLASRKVIPENFPEESIKFIHQVTSGSFLEFSKYTKYLD